MRMRIVALVGLVVLLIISILSCGGSQGSDGATASSGDEKLVRDLVSRQIKYLNARDWKSLYATCAPDFRENTDLEVFKSTWLAGLSLSGLITAKFELKAVQVNVEGETAYSIVDFYADGRVVSGGEENRYVWVSGKWYDDECE
jgi:hypothetical protein